MLAVLGRRSIQHPASELLRIYLLERLSWRLDHPTVAAVLEVALGIRYGDRAKCLADDLHQRILAASTCSPEVAFELGEGLLYGVEPGEYGGR